MQFKGESRLNLTDYHSCDDVGIFNLALRRRVDHAGSEVH